MSVKSVFSNFFKSNFQDSIINSKPSLNFGIDDMTSYPDQASFDATYPRLTTKIIGDSINDRINYIAEALNVNDSLDRSIGGIVSNTAWVLRFRWSMTAQSRNASGYEMFPVIGLSSLDRNSSEAVNQDGIVFCPYQDNLVRPIAVSYADGQALGFTANFTNFIETATSGDNFFEELKRLSATSSSLQLFSDEYVTSVESKTQTIPSTVQDLAYFVIKNYRPAQNQAGSQTGWITKLGLRNGVTTWA